MINKNPAGKGRSYRLPVCCLLLSGILAACAGLQGKEEPPPESPAVLDADSPRAVPVYAKEDHPLPGNLRFIPAPVPQLRLPPGVGIIRREPGSPEPPSREAVPQDLEESFKTGYIEALLRDTPLAGVLGGDFVHGWPPEKPAAWVQNWRSAEPQPNSWGLPSLILGLRGIAGDRVFAVTGPILDAYGRGEGLNGANGVAGYGAPRGDPFPLGTGFAQRFDLGLFILEAPEKTVFIPGEAPSAVLPCPPQTGSFPEGSPTERERIGEAFRSAWRIVIDTQYRPPEDPAAAQGSPAETPEQTPLRPDGEVVYYPFRVIPQAGGGELPVGGVYVQLFEEASIVFLLADSPALPFRVRVIRHPFTEALLASGRSRLPGAENLMPVEFTGMREDDTTWFSALLQGLALYGIPLTDELPHYGDGAYRRAQRFSRGWMILEESATPDR
ncbi:MAG: hypothetical protein LBD78_02715 [Spirochaetaceae bacterium]|nr:hypothetical protein [Spirochaetaceae bacterium]